MFVNEIKVAQWGSVRPLDSLLRRRFPCVYVCVCALGLRLGVKVELGLWEGAGEHIMTVKLFIGTDV